MQKLSKELNSGAYNFTDEELPFMDKIRNMDGRLLPFRYILFWINEVHR
jgi:hypothetical protein